MVSPPGGKEGPWWQVEIEDGRAGRIPSTALAPRM
jgi:hypothetical protein